MFLKTSFTISSELVYIYVILFFITKNNKIYQLNIIFELERLLPTLCLSTTRTSFFILIEGRGYTSTAREKNASRHSTSNPLPVVKYYPEADLRCLKHGRIS